MGNTISMCGTNAGSRKLYTFEKSKILFEKWINENSNVDVGARNVMNSNRNTRLTRQDFRAGPETDRFLPGFCL